MSSKGNIISKILSIIIICNGFKAAVSESDINRIIGGRPVSIKNHSYMVYLRVNGYFHCGGSLITRKCVLTAAHCVKYLNATRVRIHGGVTSLTQRGKMVGVESFVMPGAYSDATSNFDVAVVILKGNLSGQHISTIPLGMKEPKPGSRVKVNGWGYTSEQGPISRHLRTVTVKMISKSSCQNMYGSDATLTKTMMCASVPGTRDSCSGDSGGPLVRNGWQYGIVSWGIGCARRDFPGVYTSVAVVRPWIKNVMEKHC